MKFCRFLPLDTSVARPATPLFGLLEDGQVCELSGAPWGKWSRTAHTWPLADVRLAAPVAPGKIVCVGRNYAAHAAELGNDVPKEPMIFLKPSSSIVGPGEPIVLPIYSRRVEHEAELAVVIGRRCSHLRDSDDALENVLGYTCVNDVTARDLQKTDVQFTRAKGFDTFCPFGPLLETTIDPAGVSVETFVNGVRKQSGHTSQMIFPLDVIIRFIAQVMTLEPGDVIATGTPAGVSALASGDVVEVSVGGIGTLRNPVIAAEA
jgi:2-keto-4-pentenoate hydratase/2-oxohepta-3-ene-1,7-dioic acid hydratase in catechol pathway